jgi:hypothetical protein
MLEPFSLKDVTSIKTFDTYYLDITSTFSRLLFDSVYFLYIYYLISSAQCAVETKNQKPKNQQPKQIEP